MEEKLIIEASVKNLAFIRDIVEKWALAQGADRKAVDDLILSVDESVTNIIIHGYHQKGGQIEMRMRLEGKELVVALVDQAPLFDPTQIPPPDLTLPLEQRAEGGLGVFLARKCVDQYAYRVNEGGYNELTLRKKIS